MSLYQVMPDMTPEQFQELKEDIRHKGVVVPIEYDEQGNIIDGHHRYKAFEELINEGVDLPMFDRIVRRFDSEQAKLDYVITLNVKRRHLTAEQRQEVIVKLRKPPFGYTMSKIAELLGTSIATVSRDIDSLSEADRSALKALSIQGADGRTYSANYAPRIFTTGYSSLRNMQMDEVKKIAAEMRTELTTNGASTPPPPKAEAPKIEPPKSDTINDDEAQHRIAAFSWYGGKSSHLTWLLPLLPSTHHFVDLYGGSASVLLNKTPSPVETYNDLDNNVVNFFRVLREQPDELIKLLYFTPYAREERREAMRQAAKGNEGADPLEKARRFFVLARQSRSGIVQRSKGMLNAWRYTRDRVQDNMSAYTAQWQTGVDGLAAVAARLRNVQIENYPALHIIDIYDTPETLFYVDPPYVSNTRRKDKREMYAFEMTDADHRALATRLHTIKGRAALSCYPSELYDELYADWHKLDMPYVSKASIGTDTGGGTERIERLYTNYPLGGRAK